MKKEGLEKAYRMKQEMEIKQLDESCRQYKGKCVLWKCGNDAVVPHIQYVVMNRSRFAIASF